MLITGLHTVCDCHCITCNSVLGWKYEVAYEESQKYKEGKFILEKVCGGGVGWGGVGWGGEGGAAGGGEGRRACAWTCAQAPLSSSRGQRTGAVSVCRTGQRSSHLCPLPRTPPFGCAGQSAKGGRLVTCRLPAARK